MKQILAMVVNAANATKIENLLCLPMEVLNICNTVLLCCPPTHKKIKMESDQASESNLHEIHREEVTC